MSYAQRKTWPLTGGVHPAENKKQSLQTGIAQISIPTQLTLPLSQHIGAPAKAVVAVGDKVLKGQIIAEAVGFVSVPVHAPTSGTVTAIEPRPIAHSSGMSAACIVIDSDGQDTWCDHQGVDDYTSLSKTELTNIIRNSGIAGMGGAGFPSAVKLSTRDEHKIETLIINGTECEPYITADDILMRERAEQVIAGVKILQHIIKPSKEVLIGVEDNKPEATLALREAAKGSNIEIVNFPTKYPSGGEKQLIQILTGKEVPSGKLPADVGIVCQNIGSTVAIYQAVVHGKPLISRITTVTGESISQPQNFEVLLGTPIQHLLEAAGFNEEQATRLIMGGPMMGFALQSPELPIVKTTNCVLAPTEEEMPTPPPAQACIRCGMCSNACPVSLLPQQMYWFARAKDHTGLNNHNLFDCIECGACSFVCPSNIPLVQYYRAAKADIRQATEAQKKAEYSKERFEARQERLEKQAAEKEAQRKARQEKALAAAQAKAKAAEAAKTEADNNSTAAVDPVQAAIERAKAKAASAGNPLEDAKAKLASLEKRLPKAQEKLEQAKANNDENLVAFAGAVDKLEAKIVDAKTEIEKLSAANKTTNDAESTAESTTAIDPVQAAIERAKAKAAGKLDPLEDAKAKLASLEKRLPKAQEKLEQAKANDDENLDAFATAVAKLEEKITTAKSTLAELEPQAPVKEETASNVDPVQAAIDRAKAKRDGSLQEDPVEKQQQAVASLEKRLAKSKEKLELAEAGSDIAEALETSIAKLEDKLTQAQQALKDLS